MFVVAHISICATEQSGTNSLNCIFIIWVRLRTLKQLTTVNSKLATRAQTDLYPNNMSFGRSDARRAR